MHRKLSALALAAVIGVAGTPASANPVTIIERGVEVITIVKEALDAADKALEKIYIEPKEKVLEEQRERFKREGRY